MYQHPVAMSEQMNDGTPVAPDVHACQRLFTLKLLASFLHPALTV